jgi:hypothetical protein
MGTLTEEQIQQVVQDMWGAAQRIGMEIAAKPPEQREWTFGVAEDCMRRAAAVKKLSEGDTETITRLQMEALRSWVAKIDVGGNAQGGRA